MSRVAAGNEVRFSIARLTAWAPGVTTPTEWQEWARGERTFDPAGGEPALQQMPVMLRRHAGRLGRLACSPAYEALGDLHDVPLVFSARYGEVSRSVELLTALSAGADLSPTTFGLSVHNAVPGLFTMARRDTANSISIAAGDDAAEAGVIEACGLLEDGAERVLLVVADCPLSPIYDRFADTAPTSFGWSCLILPPTVDAVSLSWRYDNLEVSTSKRPVGALGALPLLMGVTAELLRQSYHIGQNVTSDPSASQFGQKVTSDPNANDSSAEILQGSGKIGQNVTSDPNTDRLSTETPQQSQKIGQNVTSDPNTTGLGTTQELTTARFSAKATRESARTEPVLNEGNCRVWRWTRND